MHMFWYQHLYYNFLLDRFLIRGNLWRSLVASEFDSLYFPPKFSLFRLIFKKLNFNRLVLAYLIAVDLARLTFLNFLWWIFSHQNNVYNILVLGWQRIILMTKVVIFNILAAIWLLNRIVLPEIGGFLLVRFVTFCFSHICERLIYRALKCSEKRTQQLLVILASKKARQLNSVTLDKNVVRLRPCFPKAFYDLLAQRLNLIAL